MSYQTGTMGVAEGSAIIFILLLPRVTMNSFTIAIAEFGQISWLYIVINGLDVLVMAGLLLYVHSKASGDVYSIATDLVGKKTAVVIMTVLTIAFFINATLLVRQYAEYTVVTSLPDLDLTVSVLVYALGGFFTGYLGISGVTRCSVIFMPLIIVTILGTILLLYPFYIPYQLLPWQGYGLVPCLVQGVVKGSGFNMGFLVPFILAPAFQNIRTIRRALLRGITSSVLLKVMVMIVFLMVFGVAVGSEKTMPFFEMTRLIYLNRFFQHIEALFIVVWVILGTLAIAINFFIAVYLLGRLLNLPSTRPVMLCLALLMVSLGLMPENITQVVTIDNYFLYFDNIAVYGIPVLLFIATLSKQMKGLRWGKNT